MYVTLLLMGLISLGFCEVKITPLSMVPLEPHHVDVTCPNGEECPTDNTCCQTSGNEYGCCPHPNAMCCSDRKHCCPQDTTCDLQNGTCVRVVLKNVFCPGGKQQCQDWNTCCLNGDKKTYGCCPVKNAVCCGDHQHCCPPGYTCDNTNGSCNKKALDIDDSSWW
ncbi:Prestalk protein-like [Oopsacas minuta]|uniref:Prestalk protein-like n=1 Tax=Oopsacas minuta TaxID=111878 RepID=A0AAV7K220_9METZ|nr:Prestalk protein-like [Oopsacas minuta]